MTVAKTEPIPEGYTTVTPMIISRDTAGLLEFVRDAFGAIGATRSN